jgi:hypothetical protein
MDRPSDALDSRDAALSALPSPAARAAAFAAILLAGAAGALIGYSLVELQCTGDCAVPLGLGILIGAVVTAGGMSIVAVLVLRALGEWREIQDRRPR